MNSLLILIRDAPHNFLPAISLQAFKHFRAGYFNRSSIEGCPSTWNYDHREFHSWLCKRFEMSGAEPISDIGIVSSFFTSEEQAFYAYFDLLEEFSSFGNIRSEPLLSEWPRMDFAGMIRAIRHKPALYLGQPTFRGSCAYLMGDECAYKSLGLPIDTGRELFRSFQAWVESEQNNSAQPRQWFKVIEFYGMGIDCGHTTSGAYCIFYDWLDEFATRAGDPGLFSVR